MIEKTELRDLIRTRIAKARKKRNLTQTKLSELLGRNDKYINLIECGKENVSLMGLVDIANTLDESLEYFINNENEDFNGRIKSLNKRDQRMLISLLEHFEASDN